MWMSNNQKLSSQNPSKYCRTETEDEPPSISVFVSESKTSMPVHQIVVSPITGLLETTTNERKICSNLHCEKSQDGVICATQVGNKEDDLKAAVNDPSAPIRCLSSFSTSSSLNDICRICHCEEDKENPLITPCQCSGSLMYVHQSCLQRWIKSTDAKSCELCKYDFLIDSQTKPVNKWQTLEMTQGERRKVLCSVSFHLIAITCIIWSLWVLIERTAEEIKEGELRWPFWTKLVVVAIGFAGGLVFMYVQCKVYMHLFQRLKAHNRVIFVKNAPREIRTTEQAA